MKKMYFLSSLLLLNLSLQAQITNPAPYCASQFQSNYNMVSSLTFNGTTFNGFGAVPLWSTGMTFNTYKYFNTTVLNAVNPGQTFSLSINFPPVEDGEPRYFVVWIDYNKNNTFENSERVMYNSNTINAFLPIATPGSTAVQVTKDIQVPANAQPGTTRMRIMRGQNDANFAVYDPAFTISEPCRSTADFGYGCVYDFNVQIGGGVSEITLFEDNFDTYDNFIFGNIGPWVLNDVDIRFTYSIAGVAYPNSNTAKSFMIFNATATTPALPADSSFAAFSPNNSMACFASVPGAGITANNDWMITPQIQLGATGNTVTFMAKSASTTYPDEKLRVAVSTTGMFPANFTYITPVVITTPNWTSYTYSLAAYANQNIRIGINCISDDQFALLIDNFKVTRTQALSLEEHDLASFSVSPNPSSQFITINHNLTGTLTYNLVSLTGQKIAAKTMATDTTIDVSELASGVYILELYADGQSVGKKKIVKE